MYFCIINKTIDKFFLAAFPLFVRLFYFLAMFIGAVKKNTSFPANLCQRAATSASNVA